MQVIIRWTKTSRRWGPEIRIFQDCLGYKLNLSRSGWLLGNPYNKTRLKVTLKIIWLSFSGSGDIRVSQYHWVNTHHYWLVTALAKPQSKEKFNIDFLKTESWKNQLLFYYQIQQLGFSQKKCRFYTCFVKGKRFKTCRTLNQLLSSTSDVNRLHKCGLFSPSKRKRGTSWPS